MYALRTGRPETDAGSSETGVTAVSHRVDAGTETQVLWKNSQCSTFETFLQFQI